MEGVGLQYLHFDESSSKQGKISVCKYPYVFTLACLLCIK